MKRTKTMFSRQNRESKGISRAKLDAAVSFGVEALEGRRLLSAAVPNTPILNHFIGGSETSLSLQFTDNATNETGFRVDRQVENGPFIPFATLPANPGTGLVGYVDNTVAPDTIYRYQITALNGTTESSPSLFAAASVTPSTPYAFSVTALSPTAVQLTFYDGSNIESGFGVSELSGIGVLSVNSYTFPAHPGTGFVTETINNLNAGMKYEFTLSVATKFSSSAGATSPITITMPTIAAGGASISGTVIGNPGAEQVYLDLQGVGTYVAGDPITTTDAQGKYNFTGLNAGNYLVRIKPQPGIFTTSPIYGGKYFVQLAANQVVTGDDFIVKSLNVLATANGQFIVAGKYPNNTVYNIISRYNADGTTDVTFGTFGSITVSGSVTGDAISGTVQPNGNIVVTYPGTVVTLDHNGNTLSIVSRGETINTPTNLTATATSANSIQIGFTDNSVSSVSEIFIERATSSTGPFYDIGLFAFEPYHAQPLSDSLTDASAQPNTTYYYRIYSRSNSTTTQSAYVGPVSATTPAAVGASISGAVTVTRSGSPGNIQVYLDLQGFGAYVGGDPITRTDAQGNYTFTGLQPGNYLVRIKPEAGSFIDIPVWGGKYFVQLAANQTVIAKNFDLIQLSSFLLNGQSLAYLSSPLNNNLLYRFNGDSATDVTFGTLGRVVLPISVVGEPTSATVLQNNNIVVTYPTAVVTLSPVGAIFSIVPVNNTIAAPGNLTATVPVFTNGQSQNQVNFSFVDNADNETGFIIERATLPGGIYNNLTTLPASAGVGMTVNFTDTSMTTGIAYGYRVKAVNPTNTSNTTAPVYAAMVSNDAYFVTQPDGKRLVAGHEAGIGFPPVTVTRYNTDGTIDPTFGTTTIPKTSQFNSIAKMIVLPSGSILVDVTGGSSTSADARLFPLSSTGQLGNSVVLYGGNVLQNTIDFVTLGAVGSNGKIYLFGQHVPPTTDPPYALVVEALNSDLTPDTTFGTNGRVQITLPLVGGATSAAPTGLTIEANGNIDVAFKDTPTNATHTLVLSSTGTVLVASGASISGTVFNDLNFNGTQDPGEQGVAGRQVYLDLPGIGVFSAGDPVTTTDAGGNYTFTGLAPKNYLVRLVPLAGSGISSPVFGGKFFVQLAQNQSVTGDNFGTEIVNSFSSSYQGDRKLLAGDFVALSPTDPVNRNAEVVRRFNTDGSLDLSFGSFGTSPTIEVTGLDSAAIFEKIRQLPNGNIVAWTNRYTVSTISYVDHLTLLSPGGQVISQRTVAMTSDSDEAIRALGIQLDGKIIVAGDRMQRGSQVAPYIAVVKRFNADLTPDTSFGVNGVSIFPNLVAFSAGYPNDVTVLADGRIQLGYGLGTKPVILTGSGALDPSEVLPVATNVVATPISPHGVVVQFSDNATTEDGYLIQYSSTATNGIWLTAGTVQGSPATGPRLFTVSPFPQPGVSTNYRVVATIGAIRSDPSAVASATTPDASSRIVLSNGKIVTSSNVLVTPTRLVTYLTRSNSDGTPDTSFGTGGQVEIGEVLPPSSNNYSVPQILVKSDGTLVVLSLNTYSASNTKGAIATLTSYDTNGKVIKSADATSNIGVGSPHGPDIEQIALTSDGKVLVAGTNNVFGQTPYSFVARFNADFTPDSTFGTFTPDPTFGTPTKGLNLTNIGLMNPADGIAQLADGNIIAAFGSYAVLVNSSGVIQPPGFNAPANLTGAAVASNKVHLQFTDNAVNETGFVVERSSDGGTTWSADFRPALSGTGIVQYDDFTALPATTYQYRVFAVNGSLSTGYTGPVTITTPA